MHIWLNPNWEGYHLPAKEIGFRFDETRKAVLPHIEAIDRNYTSIYEAQANCRDLLRTAYIHRGALQTTRRDAGNLEMTTAALLESMDEQRHDTAQALINGHAINTFIANIAEGQPRRAAYELKGFQAAVKRQLSVLASVSSACEEERESLATHFRLWQKQR